MKLIVSMQNNRAIPLKFKPAMNVSRDGGTVHYVSFDLAEDLGLKEGEVLHGHLTWMSDDDFLMRDFPVRNFLRYEYHKSVWTEACEKEYQEKYGDLEPERQPSKPEDSYRLMLTTDPIPEPVEPPPPPPPPTEEEILAMAKSGRDSMIRRKMNECIALGIDVETEFGVEHFSLNDEDKIMLLGIYAMVQGGATSFPYHSVGTATANNWCTVYSDDDIAKIATGAFAFITFHESYTNIMSQWLEAETDPEVVRTIEYGVDLPEEYQSYLMMIMMAAMGDNDPSLLPKNMPMMGSQIILPGGPPAPEPELPEPGTVLPDGMVVGPDGRPYDPNAPVRNEIAPETGSIQQDVNPALDPEEPEVLPTVIGPIVREEKPEPGNEEDAPADEG